MRQLIYKDFRANWMFLLFALAILFALSSAFIYNWIGENGRTDPGLVLYYLTVLSSSSILSLLFMKVDEVYQTEAVFASLPIARGQMVKARYGSGLVQAILALVVHFLGAQLGAFLQGCSDYPALESIYDPMLWLGALIFLLLFNGCSYPFYFKFGLSRGALIVTICSFLFFATFVTVMINVDQAWDVFQNSILWVLDQNPVVTLLLFAGIFLLIIAGSLALSFNIYKNKDL